MKIKIKKTHPNAVIPQYAREGDAGMDLTCVCAELDDKYDILKCDTGLAFEIPKGYVGLLFPRSSVYKKDLLLSNSVGVIDSGYRGSVSFNFRLTGLYELYRVGDRVGQIIIMPYPEIEWEVTDKLSETERGEGGYGSTGN